MTPPLRSTLFPYTTLSDLKTYNDQDGTWTGEPARREITIRDLLTHTSGLGYGAIDPDERRSKSTRLNSSHSQISYAVVCWKKNNLKIGALTTDYDRFITTI